MQCCLLIIQPQIHPITASTATASKSETEINESNRVGNSETSKDDDNDDEDDYYDYYNNLVGNGGDYSENEEDEDQVRKDKRSGIVEVSNCCQDQFSERRSSRVTELCIAEQSWKVSWTGNSTAVFTFMDLV